MAYNIWLDIKVVGIKYLARYHAGINIWKVFGYKICEIFGLVYKIFGYKIRFGYKVMAIKSLAIKSLAIK